MRDFIPVQMETFIIDSISDFNLYIKLNNKYILYRSKNLPFTVNHKKRLLDNNIKVLYIDTFDKKKYIEYSERHISQILKNSQISDKEKSKILYDISLNSIETIFNEPRSATNMKKAFKLVENQVDVFILNKNVFYNLIKITDYDDYTYHHSLNVAAYSITLAIQMGIKDPKLLNILGIGALLHDIGKSTIDKRIVNKKGGLNPQEWEIMKQHPEAGAALCAHTKDIPRESINIVLQHHERIDGSGYPHKLTASKIHTFSKIVSIADIFDAITSDRPYAKAKTTFEALKILSNSLIQQVDKNILFRFIELMKG